MPKEAWTPGKHTDKFKKAYLSGLTDHDLALLFDTTPDRIRKALRMLREAKELPARGKFVPTEKIPEGLIPSEEEDLQLLHILKKAPRTYTIEDLANRLDIAPKRVEKQIERLQARNYLIDKKEGNASVALPTVGGKSQHYFDYVNGNTFKFGIASDAHLCSKYARLDVLNTLYDIFEDNGVTTVYNAGNWIDGEGKGRVNNSQDLLVHGLGNQVNYFVEHFPQRSGMHTYYIAGDDHEGWAVQREGINIGQYAEDVARRQGREDLHYLGYMEHDIEIMHPDGDTPTAIRVEHPGGGSSTTLSYQAQQEVNSYTGGDKPHIVIMGHYHKAGYFFWRNCHIILAGCTENQTPFMRKKRLAAHLGGWIVEVTQGTDGSVLSIVPQFLPFYDTHAIDDGHWHYIMDK